VAGGFSAASNGMLSAACLPGVSGGAESPATPLTVLLLRCAVKGVRRQGRCGGGLGALAVPHFHALPIPALLTALPLPLLLPLQLLVLRLCLA
jgi:hypothetical protein